MKLKLSQAVLVEGKYDAAHLANFVEGTILTTDGFAVYKNKQLQALLKRIAAQQGLIILTDSDAAGFQIRHYVTALVGAQNALQAYVPSLKGKEPRKPEPGKEGLLGVEGVPGDAVVQGLKTALATADVAMQHNTTAQAPEDAITYQDLFEWGLSGTCGCAEMRRRFLQKLGLPQRLSKRELLQVLNTLYTRDALAAQFHLDEETADAAEI